MRIFYEFSSIICRRVLLLLHWSYLRQSIDGLLRFRQIKVFCVVYAVGIFVMAACSQDSLDNLAPASSFLLPEKTLGIVHVRRPPSLADYWAGHADFVVEVADTGLPLGESETLAMPTGHFWSFLHASYQSANVIDQCGDPVEFPGCVVIYQSNNNGHHFSPLADLQNSTQTSYSTNGAPTCLFSCATCPCESQRDHIDQQQYPKIVRSQDTTGNTSWWMVYEYRANLFLRRSQNGTQWTAAEEVPLTGIWQRWLMACRPEEAIGIHPHSTTGYECLNGSPPGIYLDGRNHDIAEPANINESPELYIFVGLGQNPGSMGCYRGSPHAPATQLRKCRHNPLFSGASTYGTLDASGKEVNQHFDFRTISSADVVKVDNRYYMLYEGVRGPEPGAAGDTQFALGLARSLTDQIDGPWERYPQNPILGDLPGNVGIGHADLTIQANETILYTSLDGRVRSRLRLVWKE